MSDSIPVIVCTLAGRELDLEIDAKGTGADLKFAIAKHWNVPAICQRLTVGMAVVEDKSLLAELHEELDSSLIVTLVTCVEEALRGLCSGSRQARQALLDAVVKLLPRRVDIEAAEALCAALEDACFYEATWAAALELLSQVAPEGMPWAVDVLTEDVANRSKVVRCAAIRGLRKVLPAGSAAAVVALGAYSKGHPAEVKLAALRAICVVAPKNDDGQCITDAVKQFTWTADSKVSIEATRILANEAFNGNAHATRKLISPFPRTVRFSSAANTRDSYWPARISTPSSVQ